MANTTNTHRITLPTLAAVAVAPVMVATIGGRTYTVALAVARYTDGSTRGAMLVGGL